MSNTEEMNVNASDDELRAFEEENDDTPVQQNKDDAKPEGNVAQPRKKEAEDDGEPESQKADEGEPKESEKSGGDQEDGDELDAYLREREEKERQAKLEALLKEKEAKVEAENETDLGDEAQRMQKTLQGIIQDTLLSDPKMESLVVDGADGAEKTTLKQMFNDYPAFMNAVVAVAARLIDVAIARNVRPYVQKQVEREAQEKTERLVSELKTKYGHSDIDELVKSKDFWDWVDSQEDRIKQLASSDNPAEVDLLLRRYRRVKGLAMPKDAEKQMESERQRQSQLHGGSLRTRRQERTNVSGGDKEPSIDELIQAFNEEDNDEE